MIRSSVKEAIFYHYSLIVSITFIATTGVSEEFIGSSRCKSCHKAEYEKFANTKHKDANRSLPKEQKNNRDCLICHSMDGNGKYTEIGCEACHGGGKYYSYDYVMKDKELSRLIGLKRPDENTCKRCHTEDTTKINKMDLNEGMKEIEHKKSDRKNDNSDK